MSKKLYRQKMICNSLCYNSMEHVSTCFSRKELSRRGISGALKTHKAVVYRPAVYKTAPIEITSSTFSVSFKASLKNLVWRLFLIALQIVYCKPSTPVKRELLQISRKASFRKRPMHVLKFSTELQNTEMSLVTLLTSDSTTFHHIEMILIAISKLSEHSQETFVVELIISIVIGCWIGHLKVLDCRPATSRERVSFEKAFLKFSKFYSILSFRKTSRKLSVEEVLLR